MLNFLKGIYLQIVSHLHNFEYFRFLQFTEFFTYNYNWQDMRFPVLHKSLLMYNIYKHHGYLIG